MVKGTDETVNLTFEISREGRVRPETRGCTAPLQRERAPEHPRRRFVIA